MDVKKLDVETKYQTQYCIPFWLRDEQIKLACQRPIRRLQQYEGPPREEPIAVVCFGPSLRDTWEEIRNFKFIITCSGAHKFLLEKGIVPTWHVEVDPREHKIPLLGPPDPRVEYLPASTCHPKYFDHLGDGPNVVLWHVFSDDTEAYRVLPRGEWAVLGGSNVGLRAMALARFFGFKHQVVFGMDGNQRETKHAAPHPLQDGSGYSEVEYEGTVYKTTPAMLESAKQTFHELNMLADVIVEFRGEGLVQQMAKKYVRKPVKQHNAFIAIERPELISASYADLNARLHRENLAYGVGGGRHAPTVLKLTEVYKTTSVLDYGCGKGYLARALPFPIWEYDPAVPGKDGAPRPSDIVVCLDVLEHIEPEKLPFVLDDLARVTLKFGYFVIHTGPSSKTLADGRNAHLIQKKAQWWVKHISKILKIVKVIERPPLLHVMVTPLPVKPRMFAKAVAVNVG